MDLLDKLDNLENKISKFEKNLSSKSKSKSKNENEHFDFDFNLDFNFEDKIISNKKDIKMPYLRRMNAFNLSENFINNSNNNQD